MNYLSKPVGIAVLVVVAVLVFSAAYTVSETEQKTDVTQTAWRWHFLRSFTSEEAVVMW